MKEKNLENVFKDALSHYEADVNPALWQSVQSALVTKGAAVSASSAATQAGSTLAGVGVKGILWISSAVLISSAGLYFALSGSDEQPGTLANPKMQQIAAPSAQSTAAPVQTPSLATAENESSPTAAQGPGKPIVIPAPSMQRTVILPGFATGNPAPVVAPAISTGPSPAAAISSGGSKAGESMDPETAAETTVPANEKSTAAEPISSSSFVLIEDYLLPDHSGQTKLPNIFKPDGDGLNDEFTILTRGLKSLEVTLFNQREQVVYQWNGLHGSWNGYLASGKEAEAGSYFYSVKAITQEGKICVAHSTLTLSR